MIWGDKKIRGKLILFFIFFILCKGSSGIFRALFIGVSVVLVVLVRRWIILAGPYNPYLYKDYLVPRAYPTNK